MTPAGLKKIGSTVWEIDRSHKEGMNVPARIYATEKLLSAMDDGVLEQITNVACLPGILKYACCMPDGHWGYGFPIGGTAAFDLENGVISPGGIGFDINCGGVDHIPVHHTNEIAQSEAATGKKWVNYWLHGEFLLMDKEKMAKSGGDFLTLSKLTAAGYDPMDYRYLCLGAHYRSQLQYSEDSMNGARSSRRNLVDRLKRIRETDQPAADGGLGLA